MVLNRFPAWKNILIVATLLLGLIYALPNVFGNDPAVQIMGRRGYRVDQNVVHRVTEVLNLKKIKRKSIQLKEREILVRFYTEKEQREAKALLKAELEAHYVVADNLAPARPAWMGWMGADPMKLGLDLSGGVHLLIQVDMETALKNREESYSSQLRTLLREQRVRYQAVSVLTNGDIQIRLRDQKGLQAAESLVAKELPDYQFQPVGQGFVLQGAMTEAAKRDAERYTMEQTLTILRTRVNELGVSEPLVQQEGASRVVVELPGVQNSAQAEDIIGRTATVNFYLVDETADETLVARGQVPPGDVVFKDHQGRAFALKRQQVLTGESIVGANASFGDQGAEVVLRLGGNVSRFTKITAKNVGKRMASVYTETRFDTRIKDGKTVREKRLIQEVINAATIQSALGTQFRITGLNGMQEARNLALLLRAGALAAPIYIVESRTIGPTLGQENIDQGMQAMMIGLALILIFMAIYYRSFGLIANVALVANLVLLAAVLSLLHAVLTLPGIAGIVLTLGMAVDANVLIFERIREELRNGSSVQASISAGFDKAFITIVDANVTTFIAAIVLFTIGTGAIKGFAVVLSVGLLTSMYTGVTVSRALVNAIYGQRTLKSLPIGI